MLQGKRTISQLDSHVIALEEHAQRLNAHDSKLAIHDEQLGVLTKAFKDLHINAQQPVTSLPPLASPSANHLRTHFPAVPVVRGLV